MFRYFLLLILTLCVLAQAQPYSWAQALQAARDSNLELQIAREKITQQENNLQSLRGALLPQLEASIALNAGANASGDDNLFEQDPRLTESLKLAARQQVWNAQTAPKIKQGELALETEKLNYEIQEINLRLQLRQEFCELLRTQQSLELAQSAVERRRQQYELVELRYSGGLEHRGSLLTAKANLTKAEFSAKQLQRKLERNKQQLAQTIGLPATHSVEIAGELTLNTDLNQTPDVEKLLETSPVLQAVVYRLENAEYNTAIAKAAFLPSVYLDLAKSWSQAQVKGENTSSDEASWSLGGSLSFDLFDSDKKRLSVQNAESNETIQKLELQNSRRTTALTLARAWDNLLDSSDSISAAQEQLQATTERSTIAAEQYANGLISFDNWIIIEDALISAQQA